MEVRPATLEGAHVRLEPLSLAHHAGLAEVLDPSLQEWFPTPATNARELRAAIAEAIEAQARGTALPFATVERASGRPVGSTQFLNIAPAHRRVEIGWTWIGRAWQRTAVNTEAKLLMMRHAFEVWRAIRVEFKTDANNAQSRAALARLGATEEGIFRNHMITRSGRIRHSAWFSVTEAEWPAVRDRLTARLAAQRDGGR